MDAPAHEAPPPAAPAGPRIVTVEELAKHNSREDMWMAFHGRVYNVTEIAKAHPGGVEVLMPSAGGDGTLPFEEAGHSAESRRWCARYEIGILEGFTADTALGILAGSPAGKKSPLMAGATAGRSGNVLAMIVALAAVLGAILLLLRQTK